MAAWLRGHESLRDLPAGAVAVWDRYLAYGAALNTNPHAVRVLDFETVGRSNVRAGYRIIRACLDLTHPVQVTGTVLDITVGARQRSADNARPGFDLPDLPTHYYLVVDDGTTDELRPWLVNRDLARGTRMEPMPVHANPVRFAAWHEALVRPFFQPGDRIRLTGQPWSRFVIALKPARAGKARGD